MNEEVFRTDLSGAVEFYNENSPRGEYVLVVEGADEGAANSPKNHLCSLSIEEHVEYYISSRMSKKDAIKATAHDRGVPKNDIYMKMV